MRIRLYEIAWCKNSRTPIALIVAIFTIGFMLAIGPAVTAASWSFSVVIQGGYSYPDVGIAVDSNGVTHIAYFLESSTNHKGAGGLYYANNAKGHFSSTCLDKTVKDWAFVQLAVDSKDCLHVVCVDGATNDLLYLTDADGEWVRTVVDSVGNTGLFPDLAVDSAGNVHISYFSTVDFYLSNTLRYANNIGGAWLISDIGPCGYSGTSIAVDSAGFAHICFRGSQLQYPYPLTLPLLYITNDGGSWSVPVAIDSSGMSPSIALDTSGKMFVSYVIYTPTTGSVTLNLASSADGVLWASEVVDGSGFVEAFPEPSLAVDANGNVHIAYWELQGPFDYYVMYAENIGGTWNIQTVVLGRNASLALDKECSPHIAYHDERAPSALMCAIWV